MFKLDDGRSVLGLRCDQGGLSLAGVSLLRKGEQGFEPRPKPELQLLLSRGLGVDADFSDRLSGIETVARALNEEDLSKALIAAVLLRLPELDWEGAVAISKADDSLHKYNSNEPRDERGRWTTGAIVEPGSASTTYVADAGLPVTPISDRDGSRSREECIADCSDLTFGATKLPPGCTGSREWEFHRCVNTCLGIGEPWPQWAPFFPSPRYTPMPSPQPRSFPEIKPQPWWLIPLIPFPGNPLYGGA